MSTQGRIRLAWMPPIGVIVLITVIYNLQGGSSASPETAPQGAPVKFMRHKLDASTKILEGLTIEDADLIVSGAKELVEMTSAERWLVTNDIMYRQFSADYQRSAKNLLEAAEKKNFDGVALKWIDTTMQCLDCHRFVRGLRLAEDRH